MSPGRRRARNISNDRSKVQEHNVRRNVPPGSQCSRTARGRWPQYHGLRSRTGAGPFPSNYQNTVNTGVDEGFDVGRQCAPRKVLTKNFCCRRGVVVSTRALVRNDTEAKLKVGISIQNPDSAFTVAEQVIWIEAKIVRVISIIIVMQVQERVNICPGEVWSRRRRQCWNRNKATQPPRSHPSA